MFSAASVRDATCAAKDPSAETFEQFVEACDGARTVEQIRALLVATAERHGFDRVLLASHGGPSHLGAFCVRAHNLGEAAHALLFDRETQHPLFSVIEASTHHIAWRENAAWKDVSAEDRTQIAQVFSACGADGYWLSKRVRSAFAPASCSLRASERGAPAGARALMRAAFSAFYAIAELQRPPVLKADKLTVREQQCMQLAVLHGMRPREVAKELGVSINTVRTLRKHACARLGARSQEEAVWRMVTTGQLFSPGRTGRQRIWVVD